MAWACSRVSASTCQWAVQHRKPVWKLAGQGNCTNAQLGQWQSETAQSRLGNLHAYLGNLHAYLGSEANLTMRVEAQALTSCLLP